MLIFPQTWLRCWSVMGKWRWRKVLVNYWSCLWDVTRVVKSSRRYPNSKNISKLTCLFKDTTALSYGTATICLKFDKITINFVNSALLNEFVLDIWYFHSILTFIMNKNESITFCMSLWFLLECLNMVVKSKLSFTHTQLSH